ncbi:extracellular solute-binding protein [Jiangella anatolica]|uniref:Sugar ABC transporter substrate-binding protein n=1 Tax=Jiangella anatolica TaxID=2670374 RepID=A0A2W2BI87_9ACTN|nr:extracellular solute-binding protein [Jiangella anatolica]PZF80024.1 sugar ABC transporter substrate-binding protein [Jiangella anatolica]
MRTTVAMALTIVAATSLVACGDSSDEGTEGGGRATLWMYPIIPDPAASEAFWAQVETDFEAANPGADVTIELQPWEGRQEKITTALASGEGFDIVPLGPDQIPQYVEQGTLAPVDDVVEPFRDEVLPNALEALSVDGTLYGVPGVHTATLPVYNMAALAQAGITEPPDTWDEIKDAAPSLAAAGIHVLNYFGNPEDTLNLTFYPFLWQNGGSVFSDDGTSVAFNEPAGVEALQFLLDLNAVGGLQPNAATDKMQLDGSAFAAGQAAIFPVTQLNQLETLGQAIGADNLVVGEPLEGKERVSYGQPGGLVLAQHAAENETAKELLAYLSSPDVMGEWAAQSGNIPTRTDVPVADEAGDAGLFTSSIDQMFWGDTHPMARQVMSVLAPHLQAALQGGKSAQQALDDAASEANALLGAT